MSTKGLGIALKIAGAIIGAGGSILINKTEILKMLELVKKVVG